MGSYWFYMYTTYFAIISLIFYVLENPTNSTSAEILRDANEGKDTLAGLAKRSLAADKCSRKLNVGNPMFIKAQCAHKPYRICSTSSPRNCKEHERNHLKENDKRHRLCHSQLQRKAFRILVGDQYGLGMPQGGRTPPPSRRNNGGLLLLDWTTLPFANNLLPIRILIIVQPPTTLTVLVTQYRSAITT